MSIFRNLKVMVNMTGQVIRKTRIFCVQIALEQCFNFLNPIRYGIAVGIRFPSYGLNTAVVCNIRFQRMEQRTGS